MQRFIRWDVRLAICVFLTSGLVACAPVAAQTDTLKLASFNILQGGTGGGQSLTKTRDVILASGADVVGVQEADGSAANLAQLLGWQYREFSFDRGTEMGNSDADRVKLHFEIRRQGKPVDPSRFLQAAR